MSILCSSSSDKEGLHWNICSQMITASGAWGGGGGGGPGGHYRCCNNVMVKTAGGVACATI